MKRFIWCAVASNRGTRAGNSAGVAVARRRFGLLMRRRIFLASVAVVFLFGSAFRSTAQVKQVEMHIAGYLCGN
ncbi:MAG TPA: hypothetical protein VGO73_08960 [Pyrinomonadaceae bacterium]|jgi:hypothetical protein|nr:hypothetical protein [Pyrinomonadaceae bacterium]